MKQIVEFNMTWSTGGNLCNAPEHQLFCGKSHGKEAQLEAIVSTLLKIIVSLHFIKYTTLLAFIQFHLYITHEACLHIQCKQLRSYVQLYIAFNFDLCSVLNINIAYMHILAILTQ